MRKCVLMLLAAMTSPALAHDTWVEPNTNLVRVGDAVHVELKLGNHGNDHRDFKLASKVSLERCDLKVAGPNGKTHDLKPDLLDVGYAPKEGYWTAKFTTATAGLYSVIQTSDQVVSYAPVRSIKSAKTFFVASKSLDRVDSNQPGFDRVWDHPLELVPTANPVTPMGPGQPIRVRLLFKGQPLAGAKISFIPRGQTLKEGDDPTYERTTDAAGQASFTPTTGNVYLVVAHRSEPNEAGPNYQSSKYSATLTVFVPEICPCCGE